MARPDRNVFLSALAECCERSPLTEKWLLAPSRRVGRQWLDALALGGQPVLNVRLVTLRALVLDLAAPSMDRKGLTLIHDQRLRLIVGRLFTELRAAKSGYLGELRPSSGLFHLLTDALLDLRLAGLASGDLDDERFEVRAKGQELRHLLAALERRLEQQALVDYPGAVRLALERLRTDGSAVPERAIVIRSEDLELAGLERRLWEAIPAKRRSVLPVDPPAARPEAAVTMRRAAGPANEVREVFRTCAARALPLDRVELIHTDAQTYGPLLYELVARLSPESATDWPVTFGDGLPVRSFRPGRALAAWVEWVRAGHPQLVLVRMIRDGLLKPDPERNGPSFARLASILKSIPVYIGRERYRPSLARAKDAAQRRQGTRGYLDALGRLESIVERVLDCSPASDETDAQQILAHATDFLEHCVRGSGELEEYARRILVKSCQELRDALVEDGAVPGLEVWDWLLGLPADLRVGGAPPSPGKLHVAGLATGGHSARPHTFVVGLDDGRHPGAGLQDPLLLDIERTRSSDELPTAARQLADRALGLQRLLARLRGEVVLSYAYRDLVDDRECFPSPVLLPIFRTLAERPEGDHEALAAWLGPPAGFAPQDEAGCIDRSDWWLWRAARALPARLDERAVARCLRFREQGLLARQERDSDRFTAFDGHVPAAGEDHDPDRPLSASRLETLGRCPLEFFLSTVLGIARPEEYAVDPDVWLDALARGSLLHGVFREFMTRLRSAGLERVEFDRDRPLLESVLAEQIEEARELYPTPDERAFERECQDLSSAALIFLEDEERAGETRRPFCFETSIGLPPEGLGTPLDSADPVTLTLPDGRHITVRGRIDRIDDAAPDNPGQWFWVWDYKTGGTYGYDRDDPLRGGRRIQGPLYMALAESRIRSTIASDARVDGFGYFFPGVRTFGERIAWTRERLAQGREALALLDEMLRRGCFPYSDEPGDVRFSDFLDALGAADVQTARIAGKLRNPANETLDVFRRLRGLGKEQDDG